MPFDFKGIATMTMTEGPINQQVPLDPQPSPPPKSRKKNKRSQRSSYRVLSFVSVFVGVVLWFLVTNYGSANPLFFPSPQVVWTTFIEILTGGYKGRSLFTHIGFSMMRILVAFVLAFLLAIPAGLASGYFKPVRAILDPYIEFYRPLPPLAYYPLLILWLGIEERSKIMLLFLAGFAPLYIAMVSGVKRVPRDRINAALSLGASQWQVFTQVVFPSCLPELFTGLRTALGFLYTTLVAAEMVAAVSGIGWMALDASKFLQSNVIFVAIILMGLIAIALNMGLNWLQNRYLPWVGYE